MLLIAILPQFPGERFHCLSMGTLEACDIVFAKHLAPDLGARPGESDQLALSQC